MVLKLTCEYVPYCIQEFNIQLEHLNFLQLGPKYKDICKMILSSPKNVTFKISKVNLKYIYKQLVKNYKGKNLSYM